MSIDLILTGNVVTPFNVYERTSIAVKGGKIVSIGDKSSMPAAQEEVDVKDLVILPGAVDTHTHSLGTPEEGHWNSTSAAAAGGVTTINDHPLDIGGAPSSPSDLQNKAEKTAKEAIVDFSLLAGGLPEKLDDILASANAGITGYKMLMHSTSGAHLYGMRAVDDGELYAMFKNIAKVDQVGMVHAENEWMINYLVDEWTKQNKTYLAAHHETRPEVAETVSVCTAIELARDLNMRLHIVHVSVPRSFDLIERARAEGVKVTGETCPHYLLANHDLWKEVGSHFKINPPLRSEESRQGLWKKIREGKVHMISSDHAPHPGIQEPNVFDNPSGSPGIETMLPLVFHEGVYKGNIDLPKLAQLMSYNPARLMGLYPQKGSIEVGSDADFAILDPQKEWVIEGGKLRAQSKWSMFEGMKITGKVVSTYVRGTKVFEDEEVIGQRGYGQWVKKVRNYDL
ncbi:amidohydrolase family protein [Alkalihalobacillus oceani]|uniref:dihydroorotase n=1 Tax=Halalkalibacter oceani TaxID=1653776 RepID=UPI00203D720E|nr:amidohydrolase family protein [Halalkalibacter oceani]MCM3760598.1 amidohydrolase family protein [Halalkalibacter oceani]